MKASDISDKSVLEYLAQFQGQWTSLWNGYFKGRENQEHPSGSGRLIGVVNDVYYAMPEGTPDKVALAKMRALVRRGLSGGCDCGCRGDFEITDKGLALIGQTRTKAYTGY
jgi:hypothetical protein